MQLHAARQQHLPSCKKILPKPLPAGFTYNCVYPIAFFSNISLLPTSNTLKLNTRLVRKLYIANTITGPMATGIFFLINQQVFIKCGHFTQHTYYIIQGIFFRRSAIDIPETQFPHNVFAAGNMVKLRYHYG